MRADRHIRSSSLKSQLKLPCMDFCTTNKHLEDSCELQAGAFGEIDVRFSQRQQALGARSENMGGSSNRGSSRSRTRSLGEPGCKGETFIAGQSEKRGPELEYLESGSDRIDRNLPVATTNTSPARARSRSDILLRTSLPNETLLAIFQDLSTPALSQVVRVCHRWRSVADRLLYTDVIIPDLLDAETPSPVRTARFCQTIRDHPHLAEAVKSFSARWHADIYVVYDLVKLIHPVLRDLSQTLRGFPNLESLSVWFGAVGADFRQLFPEAASHFPSLQFFSLAGLGSSLSQTGTAISSVLRSNPGLKHLRLTDYHRSLYLSPGDLPQLTSFFGNPHTAASILPGRPVEHVTLIGQDSVPEVDLMGIAKTSTPIEYLDLSLLSVTPVLFKDITRHMSSVRSLKVRFALKHTLHFALYGISLLAGLTPVLGNLSDLAELDLSPTSSVGNGQSHSLSEERSLCATWARACPALRRVIFPSKTEWISDENQTWMTVVAGQQTMS